MIAKAVVVVVLTVAMLAGLWLYGKLLAYAGRRSTRRSNDAANEMKFDPPPPPTHRPGRPLD